MPPHASRVREIRRRVAIAAVAAFLLASSGAAVALPALGLLTIRLAPRTA